MTFAAGYGIERTAYFVELKAAELFKVVVHCGSFVGMFGIALNIVLYSVTSPFDVDCFFWLLSERVDCITSVKVPSIPSKILVDHLIGCCYAAVALECDATAYLMVQY